MYDRASAGRHQGRGGNDHSRTTPPRPTRTRGCTRSTAGFASRSGRDPNIAFVDTRAAVAAADNPDRLFESPDGLHPSPCGVSPDGRRHPACARSRVARYPVGRPPGQDTSHTMFSATRLSPARALAACACALTLLAVPTGAQIKVGTQTVPLYVTVTDTAKRLVPDLVRKTSRSTTTASFRRSPTSTTRSRPSPSSSCSTRAAA